jgi:hypothetical protein
VVIFLFLRFFSAILCAFFGVFAFLLGFQTVLYQITGMDDTIGQSFKFHVTVHQEITLLYIL